MSRFRQSLAVSALNAGGIIAYPTEGVFGLGCDPLNPYAVERVLALKRRAKSKGLILIAANFIQLEPFLAELSPDVEQKIFSTWPGPVTWILPAAQAVPGYLTGGRQSLAVRVSAHPLVSQLCQAFGGALVSTSANVTRQAPAQSALAVRKAFPQGVDYLLNGPLGGLTGPTEIWDGRSNQRLR